MTAPFRPVRLGSLEADFERRADGSLLVTPRAALGPYPGSLTGRLEHWARVAPRRTLFARRENGAWRHVTYGEAWQAVRALGQALLDRGLDAEHPVAVLSGNDIEHGLLGLACLHVGVPYAPISTAYSLISKDFSKLRYILAQLRPGLIFAADGEAYARAFPVLPTKAELVVARGLSNERPMTSFADLLAATPTPAVDVAAARVGLETVAKLLYTSGSTGQPKGVINTQRMLCSNQAMLLACYPFLAEEPPVLVDWLPWNHTFGGNHNIGIVVQNGGSLYIDDGRPTAELFAETARNLREVAPTVYFNVPKGYEELLTALRADPMLARNFFSRVRMLFYAGASLAPHVWKGLEEAAAATIGERIMMMTGLGATETAPFAIATRPDCTGPGIVGLPAPGVTLKLVPNGEKLEARVKGPNVTPGYWRDEERTRAAFDGEGFYQFGDALAFVDEARPELGFRFDGRVSEDFKLATGTWVSVGPLRAHLIRELAPFARDVVVAGADRDDIRVLIIPDVSARAGEAREEIAVRLRALAEAATGSSMRVVRAALLWSPLSIDAGEVTDKGSVNQRAVLAARRELVESLYAENPGAEGTEIVMEVQ
jgi:feruloyl-CoA synthase